MRAFIAIALPTALRRSLATWARNEGNVLPGARWLPAENLHVTLRFLGDVEETHRAALASELRDAAARHPQLSLTVSVRGTLPKRARARVAYIGLAPSEELAALQAEVAERVERRLGLAPEGRPFHPHVTVGRSRRGWRRDACRGWAEAPCPEEGTAFAVTYLDLMESLLSPSGARYEVLESFPLRAE